MARMTTLVMWCVFGTLSCDVVSSPTFPSLFPGAKSALLCVGVMERAFALVDGECGSGDCGARYDAHYFHRCSDGWPDPQPGGTSVGVVRVRVSAAAFQKAERVWMDRVEFSLAPEETSWLCEGKPGRDRCVIPISGDSIRRNGLEFGWRWNACWLESRPGVDGVDCFPDPEFPDYPSQANVAFDPL